MSQSADLAREGAANGRSLEYAVDRMTDIDLAEEADALRRPAERYHRVVAEQFKRAQIAKDNPSSTKRKPNASQ